MTATAIDQLYIHSAAQRLTESRPGFTSKQSFNFRYNYQKSREGFKALRVFNDDFVEHNTSIPLHPHQNFEILSVILDGQMSHQDNLGNAIWVEANEVKLMSAGSGLFHGGTCYQNTNFLQIWVLPNVKDSNPTISKMAFDPNYRDGQWQLQVSPSRMESALTIKQNFYAYRGCFNKGNRVLFDKHSDAYYFLMPLKGSFKLSGHSVDTRDSAEFFSPNGFEIEMTQESDLWLMVQPNQ